MRYQGPFFIALSLTGLVGVLNAYSQDLDLGDVICPEWPRYLSEHPEERPVFTGYDKNGQKIKVVAEKDGGKWQLFVMAGAEESRWGCPVASGDRYEAP